MRVGALFVFGDGVLDPLAQARVVLDIELVVLSHVLMLADESASASIWHIPDGLDRDLPFEPRGFFPSASVPLAAFEGEDVALTIPIDGLVRAGEVIPIEKLAELQEGQVPVFVLKRISLSNYTIAPTGPKLNTIFKIYHSSDWTQTIQDE